jgi:hypothetical protein
MADPSEVGSASYTLKSSQREKTLLVCGVIDLCVSLPLVLVGLGLLLAGAWQGALALFGGLLTLWAGSVMTWGRVYVSTERLLTMQNRPHRARRNDIASIDVCRSDFGKIKQVLPIVRLKSGNLSSFPRSASLLWGRDSCLRPTSCKLRCSASRKHWYGQSALLWE